MIISRFHCKIDELVLISQMVLKSFKRDNKDFYDYTPVYNDIYLKNFSDRIDDVKKLTTSKKITDEIMIINKRIYNNIDNLRPVILWLEGYVKRAGDKLFVYDNNFGFKEIRNEIRGKNINTLNIALGSVLQNINNNITILNEQGFNDDHLKDIEKRIDVINADNATKTLRSDERKALVENNLIFLNGLWDIIADIMDAGKRVYRYKNKTKYKDYVMTILKKRIKKEPNK